MKHATLLATALAHFAAFQANTAGATIEKRDDGALGASITKISDAVDAIGTTFEEFKKTNDARLKAIEEGKSTADLDAKLAKLNDVLDIVSGIKANYEKMETRVARIQTIGAGSDGKQEIKEAVEYRKAIDSWMRAGKDNEQERRAALTTAGAALETRDKADGREVRATYVAAGTNTAGGYALPKEIESTIARLMLDISPIRQISTVRQVGTTDYHEVFDINGQGFGWVGEAGTRTQTNTADFADVAPTMGTLYAYPWATEESLDDLFFNVEQWLIESVTEGMAQGEGAAFVSGNGTNKPTGFLAGPTPVATTDAGGRAFGTLQYVPSGQAAALPTSADTFYDLIYSLRARYRANATWVVSKAILASMRKYKDTTGQYLWQPSLIVGQPATFMGFPIVEAEDMPAVAANSFPVAFGDFKQGYLVTDRVGLRITRDEITTPGFVKFYVRKRVGGKIRNSQALKLLKISVS